MVKRIEKTLVYLTFSDLFGFQKKDHELIDTLQKLPLNDTLIYISELLFKDYSDSDLKQLFLNHLAKKGLLYTEIERKVNERAIVSQQTLLALYKYVFAYGDKGNLNTPSNLSKEEAYGELILLNSIIGDKLAEEETPLEDVFVSNIYFNHSSDIWSALGRTKFMLLDIASNPDNFHRNDFLDIHHDFQQYYGYSLKEYYCVIAALALRYLNEEKQSLVTDKNAYSLKTEIYESSNMVLDDLIFQFEEGKSWAKHKLEKPWDYSLLEKRPLFSIDGNLFIPASPLALQSKIFNTMSYQIRNCYESSDTRFKAFYGKPFEKYVQSLAEHSVNISGLPYSYHDEFEFRGDRSPDAMIQLGNKLLVIEAKTNILKAKSFVQSNQKEIQDDLYKMIIDPVKQSHEFMKKLLGEREFDRRFPGVDEIHYAVVTPRKFPYIFKYDEIIVEELTPLISGVNYAYHDFEIEEFEMLCFLVEKKKGKPIFRILDEYFSGENFSFKDFLHYRNFPMRVPSLLNDKIKESLDLAISVLDSGK